jgi:hypothetical protein
VKFFYWSTGSTGRTIVKKGLSQQIRFGQTVKVIHTLGAKQQMMIGGDDKSWQVTMKAQ